MTEEERILRVTREQWNEVETNREIPEWFPLWDNLERAPRPEGEIWVEWEKTKKRMGTLNNIHARTLEWAFPYLSEEKKEASK